MPVYWLEMAQLSLVPYSVTEKKTLSTHSATTTAKAQLVIFTKQQPLRFIPLLTQGKKTVIPSLSTSKFYRSVNAASEN